MSTWGGRATACRNGSTRRTLAAKGATGRSPNFRHFGESQNPVARCGHPRPYSPWSFPTTGTPPDRQRVVGAHRRHKGKHGCERGIVIGDCDVEHQALEQLLFIGLFACFAATKLSSLMATMPGSDIVMNLRDDQPYHLCASLQRD